MTHQTTIPFTGFPVLGNALTGEPNFLPPGTPCKIIQRGKTTSRVLIATAVPLYAWVYPDMIEEVTEE